MKLREGVDLIVNHLFFPVEKLLLIVGLESELSLSFSVSCSHDQAEDSLTQLCAHLKLIKLKSLGVRCVLASPV